MTPVDKVLCLQKVPVFRHASTEMLSFIGSIAIEVDAASGEAIFSEGDDADAMYVSAKGRVGLSREGKDVWTAGEGESFGTWALFDNQPRNLTAVALEDSHLLKIRSEDFYLLLEDHDEITPAILRGIIDRMNTLLAEQPGGAILHVFA